MSFAGLYGNTHSAARQKNKAQEAKDNVVRRVCGRLSLSGEGSIHGIDGGRISKLWMSRDGKTVVSYDRGWDIRPDAEAQAAFEKIIARFA